MFIESHVDLGSTLHVGNWRKGNSTWLTQLMFFGEQLNSSTRLWLYGIRTNNGPLRNHYWRIVVGWICQGFTLSKSRCPPPLPISNISSNLGAPFWVLAKCEHPPVNHPHMPVLISKQFLIDSFRLDSYIMLTCNNMYHPCIMCCVGALSWCEKYQGRQVITVLY